MSTLLEYRDRLAQERPYKPLPANYDEVGFSIIHKIPAGSRTKLNQAQLDSINNVYQFGIQKIVEANKIWPCHVADDLAMFVFDRVYAAKPFAIEQNGIKHKQTIQECLTRQSTYRSWFYVSLSVWIFSSVDPRTPDKRRESLAKFKKKIRMQSKAKRIRFDHIENNAIQNLERRQHDYFKTVITNGEEEKEIEIKAEDFEGHFDLQNPMYITKRDQGFESCRLSAYEKNKYPYFLSKMTWSKHTCVGVPVMPDSVLCHVNDDLANSAQNMYTAGGPLILLGLEHPFNRTPKLRFNEPFIFDPEEGKLQIRSGHADDQLRSSSSTLDLEWTISQTYAHEHLQWKIPYVEDFRPPLVVPFRALGIMDDKKIARLVMFHIKHYFRKEKYLPLDSIANLVQWSIDFHARDSQLITTQKEALIYLGKLSEKHLDENHNILLIEDHFLEPERAKPTIPKPKTLSQKKREAAALAGLPIPARYERDQADIWEHGGFVMMVREILPHVSCNFKRAAESWKAKAMHLAHYVAKSILFHVRHEALAPARFMTVDTRDSMENRRIQLCSEWISNNLLRGTLSNHFKMFHRECLGALHNEEDIEPKISLDSKRPTNIVDNALNTGIIRSRNHPALVASQFKNGKKDFKPPDSHKKQNTSSSNGGGKNAADKVGITQLANYTNLFSTISGQIRVNGNARVIGANSGARHILDHFRVVDFNETPDNRNAGTVFPLALFSRISITPLTDDLLANVMLKQFEIFTLDQICDAPDAYDFSRTTALETERDELLAEVQCGFQDFQVPSAREDARLIRIQLNGRCLGWATAATIKKAAEFIRQHRYRLMGESFVSVSNPLHTRALELQTDQGRFVSAVLNVKRLPEYFSATSEHDPRALFLNLSWDQTLKEGFVEMIDKAEENNDLFICTDLRDFARLMWISVHVHKDEDLSDLPFTHCEIHMILILGWCSSQIPGSEFNQGTRNTYGSNILKQGMAGLLMSTAVRMDSLMHNLSYSTKSLTFTQSLRFIRATDASPGFNSFGAIMCERGFNIEDSIIVNAAAAERGFGRSVQTTTTTVNEMKLNSMNQAACFRRPNRNTTTAMRTQQYSHLDTDGFPFPNENLTPNHIMVGRTRPLEDQNERYDCSVNTLKKNMGIVKLVKLTSDDKAQRKGRVQTAKLTRFGTGDKLCLTPTAEVLTQERGWVALKDLTLQDAIATLQGKENIVYEKPSAINRYACEDEDLYYLRSQQIHTVCTLNHKLYVKLRDAKAYCLVEAKEVKGRRVQFKKNGVRDLADVEYFEIKNRFGERKFKMDYWLNLLGMFISDGYVDKSNLALSGTKKRKLEHAVKVCKDLDVNTTYYKDGRSSEFGYNSRTYMQCPIIREELSFLSVGAIHKRLPSYALSLNQRQSRILLASLISGDGTVNKSTGCERYFTSSKHLANDVSTLAFHAGYSGTVYFRQEAGTEYRIDDRVGFTNADSLAVAIIKSKNTPTINHGHIHQQHGQEEKLIKYTGTVMCPTTSSGVFYYREHYLSPPHWTGNSSCHAMKTICGAKYAECDMPFTESGIIIDWLLNPHSIPSRMSLGHLMQMQGGNVAVAYGKVMDMTSFATEAYKSCMQIAQQDFDFLQKSGSACGDTDLSALPSDEARIEVMASALRAKGWAPYGEEIFYNGRTGERIGATGSAARGAGKVFMGPMQMYKLTHLAVDKLHSRVTGLRHILTRQGVEGSKLGGAYRMGDMERTAIITHGCSFLLRERHFLVTDPFVTHFCYECGMVSEANILDEFFYCKVCKKTSSVGKSPLCYSFSLIYRHLLCAGIMPRYAGRPLF